MMLYSCSWGKYGLTNRIWLVWCDSQTLCILSQCTSSVQHPTTSTVNVGTWVEWVSAFLCSTSHSLSSHQQSHYCLVSQPVSHCTASSSQTFLFTHCSSFCFLITLSIQYIFNILLQQHISNASLFVSFTFPYCLGFYNTMKHNLRHFFLIQYLIIANLILFPFGLLSDTDSSELTFPV